MQTFAVQGICGKDGALRGKYYLYVLIAKAVEGQIVAKVGISGDPWKRMKSVQTGCPFKITEMTTVQLAGQPKAKDVEGLAHKIFAPCRSSGEWFVFKKDEPEHMRLWGGGLSAALNHVAGKGKWNIITIDMAAHSELAADNRRESFARLAARKKKKPYARTRPGSPGRIKGQATYSGCAGLEPHKPPATYKVPFKIHLAGRRADIRYPGR